MEIKNIDAAAHEAKRRITIGQVLGGVAAAAGIALSIVEPFGSEPSWMHESISQEDALGAALCVMGAGLIHVGRQFRQVVNESYSAHLQSRHEL